MRILLQFPEGLKKKAVEIARKYEKEGHEVFLSASACYGACDIAIDEARWLRADKIVHFGHNRFMKADLGIPVEYVEYSVDIDISALKALLPHLEGHSSIALATTVQHVHQLDAMKAFLEKNGKRVLIGKGERANAPGQVLGCDAGAIKSVEKGADAIVFVGDGMFHALAVGHGGAEVPAKPVLVFNPYDHSVRDVRVEIERLRKRRKGALAAALSCSRFGVLLSTKPGQFNIEAALWAKKELEEKGLEADILVANELEPLALQNFLHFDCYVSTACPRMADDSERFGRPILDIVALKELLALKEKK